MDKTKSVQTLADKRLSYAVTTSDIAIASAEDKILGKYPDKGYRVTPVIVTFHESELTYIDVQNIIEQGLQIVRFRMTNVTKADQLKLIEMIRKAQELICEKYSVSSWPIAMCIDIPNAAIRSGYITPTITSKVVRLIMGSKIEVTTRSDCANECHCSRIYIDDPYTIQVIKIGDELTFCSGGTKLICVELKDKKSIICKVIRDGFLYNNEFVAVRGIKYKRPPISGNDLKILEFAKEFKYDIITVFSVRFPSTINKIRKLYGKDYQPLLLSTICDQEGLENIDGIIKVSDGIILAREYLTHQLVNRSSLAAIQMQICAKCRLVGKPFFFSGNILEQTLQFGTISSCDLSDITNGVLQGAGFALRQYHDAGNLFKAVKILNNVCKAVEDMKQQDDFKRIVDLEFQMPVNAADACVVACALLLRQSGSVVAIIPTVTGRTAVQLSHIAPMSVIITVSRDPAVARKLQLYRGIYAIFYDKPVKKNWLNEMDARVHFAVSYGLKKDVLSFGHPYVLLRKSTRLSPFCDSVSLRIAKYIKE